MSALALRRPDPNWHETPEAKAILHRIRANPPRGVWIKTQYGHRLDEHFEYVGADVAALEAICERVGGECLRLSDMGEPDAFAQWHAIGTVNDVIARTLNDARVPAGRSERMISAIFGGVR